MIIYVHNLGYEFQFMRKHFEWDSVFARKTRRPMKAVTGPFTFKCSLFLSGYSLATVAKNLHKYKIEKLTGDLDYTIPRHYQTNLTDKELGYCYNDVIIVEYFIREEIERNGDITKIPLTQTGYIRKQIKQVCFPRKDKDNYSKFNKLIKSLTLEVDEYKLLKRAYSGGFTHASCYKSNKLIHNVTSYDLTSAYPSVMALEYFPMSKGKKIHPKSKQEFRYYLNKYCCIFDIVLYNVKERIDYEHIISASKCWQLENPIIDNGRIVSADSIGVTLTEIDYDSVQKFYFFDGISLGDMYIYARGYLPKPYLNIILELYGNKTTLKGIENMEVEYMHSKQLINSLYGMMVTDISPEPIAYTSEWGKGEHSIQDDIDEYNKQKQRTTYYPWGVYITSYTRRNVFSAIQSCGYDYCYSDTDSVKIENAENHNKYFKDYNKMIQNKINNVSLYYNIDNCLFYPCDKDGKEHPLGFWDYDGFYPDFKTLGAKRYLTRKEGGKLSLTLAGVNKNTGCDYLQTMQNPFKAFKEDLIFPKSVSGRNTLTYVDEPFTETIIDYLGQEEVVSELSYIHMETSDYKVSLSEMYLSFLKGFAKFIKGEL